MADLLNLSSVMMCPHGGQVQIATANTRTRVAGDFVLRQSDTFVIAGCPFFLGPVAHPCVQVQWVQPSAQGQVSGDFALTEESVGLCVAADLAVQGTVLILETQPRASGL
jgi:hypothetical protein